MYTQFLQNQKGPGEKFESYNTSQRFDNRMFSLYLDTSGLLTPILSLINV